MNIRGIKIIDDSLGSLKSDFECFIRLLIEDNRDKLRKGVLETIGFEASPALCFAAGKGSAAQGLSTEVMQLYRNIIECTGRIDIDSTDIVKIPVNALFEKIAATNKYTATKNFEALLMILDKCCESALKELERVIESAPLDSAEKQLLEGIANDWHIGLDTLKDELKDYKVMADMNISPAFFAGFEYVRPGEDAVSEKKDQEEKNPDDTRKMMPRRASNNVAESRGLPQKSR